VKGNVELGKGVYVASGAEIVTEGSERITVGGGSFILRDVLIHSYGGPIRIGDSVGINPFTVIYGHGGVHIGNKVLIATSCVLIPANHNFDRLDVPIQDQGLTCQGITVEDDVWLAARVTVLDGVTIGQGSVVGAGAVVTKSLPPYSIAVGVPARIIGSRKDAAGGGG
jgi:acetyltransferase-like isoleucine patch superfamily enzyme